MTAQRYKARIMPNRLIVVRDMANNSLSGVGLAGFHKPRIKYHPVWKQSAKAKQVIAKANAALAAATEKAGGKAPWSYADRHPTVKSQFAEVKLITPKKGSSNIRLHVVPGEYGNNLRARDVLRAEYPQTRVRALLREENRSKGKRGYATEFSQLLGASGLLSIGGKYLVIPNRGHTRLYDSYYHVIGGIVESNPRRYSHNPTLPAKQALNEIHEETGFDKRKMHFIGKRFKTVRSAKRAPAIAFARSMEKVDPSADLVHGIIYKTKNPDAFIKTHFREKEAGKFVLGAKPKSDEAAHFAIIPQTVAGVDAFIEKNNNVITPVLRIALEALKKELMK